jgi:membrane protease YdiL (CAAX protease family)
MTETVQSTIAIILVGMYAYCMLMYFSEGIRFSPRRLSFSLGLSLLLTLAINREVFWTPSEVGPILMAVSFMFVLNFLKIHFSIEVGLLFRHLVPTIANRWFSWWFLLPLTVFYGYLGSRYTAKNPGELNLLDVVIFVPIIEEITFRFGLLGLFNAMLKSVRYHYFISSVAVSVLFAFMHPPSEQHGIAPLYLILFPLSLLLCQVRVRSIYHAIGIHCLFNLSSIFFTRFLS